MEKYVAEINRIKTLRENLNASTTNKSNPLKERKVRVYLTRKTSKAGYDFLERIHQDIFSKKPQWEQDLIKADMEALARGEDEVDDRSFRPELNDDYLKSIGREDLTLFGSNKEPENDLPIFKKA